MPKAVIFDYGVGNLLSLKCALEKVGLEARISVSPNQLKNAGAIALPGVGNFSAATSKLDALRETLLEAVENGTPILGICLGLQLFFQQSEEGPGKGLMIFNGKSIRLKGSVKVPHMGWNTLQITRHCELLEGITDNSYVYFVHSLYTSPADAQIIVAKTEYGVPFTSAVASRNVYGTQFHPEKSGDVGLKILGNFAKIIRR
jgi:imidazole glycerol-phosphate synthase subunit HisH